MLSKKRRSSLCHTGLSKAALQALAVTGSFSFQESVESTAHFQLVRLAHWIAQKSFPTVAALWSIFYFLPRSKWITRLRFCITFVDAVPFFWPSTAADRQPEKDPSQTGCTHHGHVLLRCLTYVQPGLCLMPPSDHVCKSTAQHMGYRAHAQIQNRNLACLTGKRARNSLISTCLCESWGRCMDSLSHSHLLLISVVSIKHAGLQSRHTFNLKLVCRPNVNYNDCLSLLAYK